MVLSRGDIGEFSTKTGVDFPFLLLLLPGFLGKTIFIDDTINNKPDKATRDVFQKVGRPKNGIRKIKIPRKKVFLR